MHISQILSSTIIEECVYLVRTLHSLREWHGIVNSFLQSHLSTIVTLQKPSEGLEAWRDLGIAAALTLIGGYDTRIRIGGNVHAHTATGNNLLGVTHYWEIPRVTNPPRF